MLIRKLTLLLGAALLSACATTKPVSPLIQADGFGRDCTEALKQAKLKAAEDYKGTFLNSQRTLVNDRKYSESIDEYSGGVVQSYKVKSSLGNSPCFVSIEAKVVSDNKSIVVNSESSIDLGSVERNLNQQISTQEMLRKMVQRPEMIKVESRTIKPIAYDDGSTGLAIQFTKIVPSPKWMNDLESFLSVHGSKQTYRERNAWAEIGKGLLALAALPILIPVAIIIAPFTESKPNKPSQANPGDQFSLCFAGKEEVNCYQGWAAEAIYEQLNSAAIVAVMNKEGAPMAGFQVRGGSVSLNQYFDINAPLFDDQSRPKKAFNIVGIKPINLEGSLNLASDWVSDGHDLKFRVKFN